MPLKESTFNEAVKLELELKVGLETIGPDPRKTNFSRLCLFFEDGGVEKKFFFCKGRSKIKV